MMTRVEELKRLFLIQFKNKTPHWQVPSIRPFVEGIRTWEGYGEGGFYKCISAAIETHIAQSLNELKKRGLTTITPVESSSGTKESKQAE